MHDTNHSPLNKLRVRRLRDTCHIHIGRRALHPQCFEVRIAQLHPTTPSPHIHTAAQPCATTASTHYTHTHYTHTHSTHTHKHTSRSNTLTRNTQTHKHVHTCGHSLLLLRLAPPLHSQTLFRPAREHELQQRQRVRVNMCESTCVRQSVCVRV